MAKELLLGNYPLTVGMFRIYHDSRMHGVEHVIYGDPKDAEVWLPPDITKCVCFLCVKHDKGWHYGGTGFFVHVPSENDGWYGYLITAKHNIEHASRLGSLHLRLNTRSGGADYVDVSQEWYSPTNSASDIAVLPFTPGGEIYDYVSISAENFCATEEMITKYMIGIGDDLVIPGLFTERRGAKQNAPIVRIGNIAAIPGEPLIDDSGAEYRAYLAEVRSIGGLSGSPVFAYIGYGRSFGKSQLSKERKFVLIGVVRGHWDFKSERGEIDFGDGELKAVNMGIAIVTPIQEAMAVINCEEWVKQRHQQDAEDRKRNAPTLDSAFPSKSPFTKQDFEVALRKAGRRIVSRSASKKK